MVPSRHLHLLAPTAAPAAPTSRALDRAGYTPEHVLGVGPDGVAVAARDLRDGALVELRLLASSMSSTERAAAARRLALLAPVAGAGVRSILAIDLEGPSPFLALAPATGPALGSFRAAHGFVAPHQVALAFERVALALAEVHRLSFHHGDLRPETLHYGADGVLSFELSGLRVDRAVSEWARACTAPDASAGPAHDVYALGALAMGLLAPGGGGEADSLRAVVARALAVDPDERPSATTWALELRAWRELRARAIGPAATVGFEAPRASVPSRRPPPAAPTHAFEAVASTSPDNDDEAALDVGQRLGRYELVACLGAGGMGEAWKARDAATGATVAVKVLRRELTASPPFVRRFRREARALAAAQSPYVANLLDVNEDHGRHYLVMEFVAGGSVAGLLRARGALPEVDALSIVADACRALVGPHRVGIVHRDLKPDNLLLVDAEPPTDDRPRQRVKVCDFGIARPVEPQPGTVQVTVEGTLVGTPAYMAPEQCRGVEALPSADVYALGCTLFECLTGRPPFEGASVLDTVTQQLHAAPPDVRARRAEVSDATAELVARCLAKEPRDRPADAASLLADLEAILRCAPVDAVVHPALPPTREGWTRRFVFEWDLAASPARVWPVVADTDGMNRAAGFAPVRYEHRPAPGGGSERFGESSALGIPLRWREFPYEWVEGRRHVVFRAFERGVLAWYCAEVTLTPLPEGGTRVRHTVTVEPRGWLGYLASPVEVGLRYRRALERIYRRVDALARASSAPLTARALQPEVTLAPGADEALARAAAALAARGVDPVAADAVLRHLREASDTEVARIRPFALAASLGLAPDPVADACLVLAREGALTLLWDVLCPSCQASASVVESLERVRAHAHCPACNADFRLDFGRSVELIFRAAPAVREAETRTFCASGPGRSPHAAAQVRLAPGERIELALALDEGAWRVRSPQLPWAVDLQVTRAARSARADLAFADATPGASRLALSPGEQRLTLHNRRDVELVVRVERPPVGELSLTAARACTLRRFRELFGDQVLAPGALVAVSSATLLCASVRAPAALYRALGDGPAHARLLAHFRAVEDVAGRHRGALVKTVGARALVAFERADDALACAAALRGDAAALPVAVAVHRGPMLAATVGGRLDYFGRHAELCLAVPDVLRDDETFLSQDVACDEGVRRALTAQGASLDPRRVEAAGEPCWGVVWTASAQLPRS